MLAPPPPHKKRPSDHLLVNPTQPLLSPQTIMSGISKVDSFNVKQHGELDLTPITMPTSIKCGPVADDGAGTDAAGETLGAPPHKKRTRHCLPTTPIQPLFMPQATQQKSPTLAPPLPLSLISWRHYHHRPTRSVAGTIFW